MQNVSAEYKEQIRQRVRNPSYIKILFKVVDPQAQNDHVVSDTGSMYWSNSSELTGTQTVTENYFTLEQNRGILNGKYRLPIPDGQSQVYQGYVGSLLSNSTGVWSIKPTVRVNFLSDYYQFAGLSMKFDTILGDYPKNLNIKVYKDNVLVQTIACTPTSPEFDLFQGIQECNRIDYEAVDSKIPFRRFRMEEIILGIKKVFTESNIIKGTWKHEIDLINSKLPVNDFDFTILDKDREYDPENVVGIYTYMEAKQECGIELGYELNDGTIDWMPVGKMFTTGDISVKSDAIIPTVDFKTKSSLAFLTQTYSKGKYYSSGRTLYDLALDVLSESGIPLDVNGDNRWYIDPILQNYTTRCPLPMLSQNVLLQLIANAGMCILDIDREGFITIKQKDDTALDFGFTLGDIMSPPVTSKYPQLQGVDTFYNTVSVGATAEQLGEYNISGASSTVYELTYDSATDITATAGSGLTIVGTPEYYAGMCKIKLTGTGTLTITGKKISINKTAVSVEYNTTGERCPIENSLITSQTHAVSYANWIGAFISRRIEYELEDRGFPEIDTGDNVKLDTLFTENVRADVLKTEVTYDGTLSGKTKVLKK